LDIQTRLSDKNKREISDCLIDTLTNPCGQKFAWTVSGPEGGIAITPVANTEYHPLLKGGGATGCGIDTKVELRKISEKYLVCIKFILFSHWSFPIVIKFFNNLSIVHIPLPCMQVEK
jgi:hypothetical protein